MIMTKLPLISIRAAVAAFAFTSLVHAQVSLTTDGYTQDFNSIPNVSSAGLYTWTDNSTIQGWYGYTVNAPDTLYRASNANNQWPGTGATATSLFAFRPNGTEAALGSLSNSTYSAVFGAQFINNTGAVITSLTISYTGEQWNWNTATVNNTLQFTFSEDATSLTDGSWTDYNDGDFASLFDSGTGAGLNGNSNTIYNGSGYVAKTAGQAGGPGADNFTDISVTISGLSIAQSDTFWIRWSDDFSGVSGNGQGLGIDNLSVSAVPEPGSVAVFMSLAVLGFVAVSRRFKRS